MEASLILSLNNFVNQSIFLNILTWFLATHFVWLMFVGSLGLILFAANVKDRKEEFIIFLYVLISAIYARGLTEVIRLFYDRPRPFEAMNAVNELFSSSSAAFPSGHATFFFGLAMATFLYHRTLGKIFLAMAFINALARVASGVHWPSDVLAGAALGIFIPLIFRGILEKFRKKLE